MEQEQKGCGSILMRLLAGSQQRVVVGEEEGTGGVEKRRSETTRPPVVRVMKATRTRENKRSARVHEKKARGNRVVGTATRRVLVLGGNPERSVPSNASTFRRGDVQTRKFVPSKVAYNHYKEYHEGTCDDDTEFEQCAEENPVVNDLVDNNICSWEGQGRIQY
ncbi:hypothetical protein PSENEW3n2_00001751 [Picochlorum sp. SENEW3]|nr:hypothetical protein PSENEW3n2_00001751 [Picochlorum sp. SENEW3]WPT14521.1 hypothetical protein PSENEW3_00001751 [Picochlorum sp. SENEW3]